MIVDDWAEMLPARDDTGPLLEGASTSEELGIRDELPIVSEEISDKLSPANDEDIGAT